MNADATPMNADEALEGREEREFLRTNRGNASARQGSSAIVLRRSSAGHRRSSAFPKTFAY
jgi:hypothetical protein